MIRHLFDAIIVGKTEKNGSVNPFLKYRSAALKILLSAILRALILVLSNRKLFKLS